MPACGGCWPYDAAPRHDRIQITAKDLGDGSGRLAQLRPGTAVLIEGPYGRLTAERRTMPSYSPVLIQTMRTVLDEMMTRLPFEQATPGIKAAAAECILKAAAGGQTSYEPIPFRDSVRIESQNRSGKNNYYQFSAAQYGIRTHSLYFFGQDTWKLTPRLTVDLGTRYEYNSPQVDPHNNITFTHTLGNSGEFTRV